jgi:aryl-alcohol dehydrogenase-like predicted oxidoreductase
MNLSHAYGTPPPREQAVAVLEKAFELGITHFDSATLYGFGRNEALVGPVLKPVRDRILLTSK